LRASHDRLTSLVEALGPDQVAAPSLAAGWSIAQVLSHLGSQAEIFGAILDAGLDQREPPAPDTFPSIWDAWNARTPTDQVAASVAANGAFVARVEALSDAQLDGIHISMFGMEIDAVTFLQMRLSEHAVHTWDVAAALDPGARVSADAVDLLVDTLPRLAARVGEPQVDGIRLRIVSSGPARDLVLVVHDEVRIDQWDGAPADGVLRLPAEALVRLVYGRLDDRHVPSMELDAGGLTLDRLRSVFPGL